MSFREDLGGFAVIQDYVEEKDSRVTFRGHGVFTVDPASKAVLWYWFDSIGFPPEAAAQGTFEGDVLTLQRESPRGVARYVYRISKDSCEFSIENKWVGDADFKPFMSGKYTRKD